MRQTIRISSLLCKRSYKCVSIWSVITVIFLLEVVVYTAYTFYWNSISCMNKNACTRILLVADPQLIGLRNEKSFILTPFSIWDSDRYISKTFNSAFTFVQPDVVIFLGDLLDEGSIANDVEFKSYVRRLFNIFLKSSSTTRHIWLPGDNDIGGEGNDQITQHNVKRFQQAFSQPDVIAMKNVKFYKINRLLQSIPKIIEKKEFFEMSSITVGVSHMPLMFRPALFVDKVLTKLQPHLLFTAHEHKSMIVSTDAISRTDRLIVPITSENNHIYEYSLGVNQIYEVVVPTCSYRMGTDKIGYGFAVLENGMLHYTVLWTPSRFLQLYIYCVIAVCTIAFILFRCCCIKCTRTHKTIANL